MKSLLLHSETFSKLVDFVTSKPIFTFSLVVVFVMSIGLIVHIKNPSKGKIIMYWTCQCLCAILFVVTLYVALSNKGFSLAMPILFLLVIVYMALERKRK